MWQQIIVGMIILIALWGMFSRLYKKKKRKDKNCKDGACEGCPLKDKCRS